MQGKPHLTPRMKTLIVALITATLLSACATVSTPVAACKTYCTTQDEGYQWAQQSDLHDAAACAGYAAEFSAGCRLAVVDAQQSQNPQRAY